MVLKFQINAHRNSSVRRVYPIRSTAGNAELRVHSFQMGEHMQIVGSGVDTQGLDAYSIYHTKWERVAQNDILDGKI